MGFVARKAWVEKNPEEAAFLIKIWDRGVQEWKANRDKIIELRQTDDPEGGVLDETPPPRPSPKVEPNPVAVVGT